MASHSSILAWTISWTQEPRGLQSMGSQRGTTEQLTVTYFNLTQEDTQKRMAKIQIQLVMEKEYQTEH